MSGLEKRQLELIGTATTKALHPNALKHAVDVQLCPHQILLQWQMSQHHLQTLLEIHQMIKHHPQLNLHLHLIQIVQIHQDTSLTLKVVGKPVNGFARLTIITNWEGAKKVIVGERLRKTVVQHAMRLLALNVVIRLLY